MFELQGLIKNLLLPPGVLILIGLLGVWYARRILGRLLLAITMALLLVLSLPFFSDRLLCAQQTIPPLRLEQARASDPQAIIVLGGGSYRGNTEYGGDTVSGDLLVRLRYAAWLARHLDLPVIPSGGSEADGRPSEARLAQQVLVEEFGVTVAGIEGRSRTTWENAQYSAELLHELEMERVLLVTHAWHIPRALQSFQAAGIAATPAPTLFQCPRPGLRLRDWTPSSSALDNSRTALHEILGRWVYALRQR